MSSYDPPRVQNGRPSSSSPKGKTNNPAASRSDPGLWVVNRDQAPRFHDADTNDPQVVIHSGTQTLYVCSTQAIARRLMATLVGSILQEPGHTNWNSQTVGLDEYMIWTDRARANLQYDGRLYFQGPIELLSMSGRK